MIASTRRVLALALAVLTLLTLALPAAALASTPELMEQEVLHAEMAQRAAERRLDNAEAVVERLRRLHEEHAERLEQAEAETERLTEALDEAKADQGDNTARAAAHTTLVVAATTALDEATDRVADIDAAVTEVATAIEAAEAEVAAAAADVGDAGKASRAAQRELNAVVLRSSWEAGQPGSSGLLWPTDGKRGSPYGYRTHPITGKRRLHAGTDIPAPTGTPILAVAAGKVVSASSMRGYGKTVLIDHGDDMETLYAHASKLDVDKGDKVEAGDQIARVGSTGQSTGPHLHFEIRIDGEPVNPMSRY